MATQTVGGLEGGLDSRDWKCSNPECGQELPGEMVGMRFCPFCAYELRRAGPPRTRATETPATTEGKGTEQNDGSRSSLNQAPPSPSSDLTGETACIPEKTQIASGDATSAPTVEALQETLQSLPGGGTEGGTDSKTADTNSPSATETAAAANFPSVQTATDTTADTRLPRKTDTDAHVDSHLPLATDITVPSPRNGSEMASSSQPSSDTPSSETSEKVDEYSPEQETGDNSDKEDAKTETDNDTQEVHRKEREERSLELMKTDEARKQNGQKRVEERRRELADTHKAQQVSQMMQADDNPLQVKAQGAGKGDGEEVATGTGTGTDSDVGGPEKNDGKKSAQIRRRGRNKNGAGGKNTSGESGRDNGGVVEQGDSRDGGVVGTTSGGGDSAVAGGTEGSGANDVSLYPPVLFVKKCESSSIYT